MTRDEYFTALNAANEHLEHHGILGQRWGIRRFQNKDGSLTEEGKKKYNTEYKFDAEKKIDDSSDTKKIITNFGIEFAATAAMIAVGKKYIKNNKMSSIPLSKIGAGTLVVGKAAVKTYVSTIKWSLRKSKDLLYESGRILHTP